MHYLALGDSYTIGTGAADGAHNFPSILGRRVSEALGRPVEVTNPAVNGYTTLDLIRDELPLVARLKPDLVSILIGVNDLVQGRGLEAYRDSLRVIHATVAELRLPPGRIVSISIPNWSVVPAASSFGVPAEIRALTDRYNEVARMESEGRGFTWIDLGEVSTSGSGPGWIASDNLHPGDAQYAAWADHIWTAIGLVWTAAAGQ